MRLRSALLGASFLTLPVAAAAQPVTGPYIGAGVGPNIHVEEGVKNLSLGTGALGGVSTSANAQFNVGFAGEGSFGYGFGNGLRLELEGDFITNHSNGFTNTTRGFASGGGTELQYGFMANALYDFVDVVPVVQPYVGVGLGMQWVNWNSFRAYNTNTVTVGTTSVFPGGLNVTSGNNGMGVFAYQLILGVALPIQSVPGLALTADYRFMGTAGNRSTDAVYRATTSTGAFVSGGGKVQFGPTYDNMFLFGVRYNFGQAPPPPSPVTAPAPMVQSARSYLVFFDWDKATLTDRAQQIIRDAADNSTHVQYTRIDVNGYTDTSGTPQYNMELSIRRAEAVKNELIKDGVPSTTITTRGFGETHLLVPTGSGVREPQNRRVEIVIH